MCEFDGNQIVCEGYSWGQYKLLRFPVGCTVHVKFGHQRVKAKIKSYTKTKCVLDIDGTREKRISFSDLIQQNHSTEICIRIEKNGVGPYRCKETVSEEFLAWKKEASRLFYEDQDSRNKRPAPEEDSTLSQYYNVGSLSSFGFKSYEQMFEWFPLSEISFLITHGFSVVVKQKGLDYFESLSSYRQMAIVKDEESYNSIINNPVREYV